jgi:hypothetical protein
MPLISLALVFGGLGAIAGVLIASLIWSHASRNGGGDGGHDHPLPPGPDWDGWLKGLTKGPGIPSTSPPPGG